jgi:hypothetical protein
MLLNELTEKLQNFESESKTFLRIMKFIELLDENSDDITNYRESSLSDDFQTTIDKFLALKRVFDSNKQMFLTIKSNSANTKITQIFDDYFTARLAEPIDIFSIKYINSVIFKKVTELLSINNSDIDTVAKKVVSILLNNKKEIFKQSSDENLSKVSTSVFDEIIKVFRSCYNDFKISDFKVDDKYNSEKMTIRNRIADKKKKTGTIAEVVSQCCIADGKVIVLGVVDVYK